MKRKEYRIGPGAASLLLVVVVVSLALLALLALMNARGDYRLTERSISFTLSEYEASARSERSLAELDGIVAACRRSAGSDEELLAAVSAELPDFMYMEGAVVSWEENSGIGRTLMCAVEILPMDRPERCAWINHSFAVAADDFFEEDFFEEEFF